MRCHSASISDLSVTTTTLERCEYFDIVMRQVKDWLWEPSGLDDAPDFDCPFFLDKLSHGSQQCRRKLPTRQQDHPGGGSNSILVYLGIPSVLPSDQSYQCL